MIAFSLCETYDKADAVMDRLVNGSFRIEMQGESMRKNIKKVGCYQKANMQCFRKLEMHQKWKIGMHDLIQI